MFLGHLQARVSAVPALLHGAVAERLEYQLCKAAVYRYHYGDAVRFADPQSHALATATLDEWLELYKPIRSPVKRH